MSVTAPPNSRQSPTPGRWRVTYLVLGAALVWWLVAWGYAQWRNHQAHAARLPTPGLATVAAALRTFHRQTGRFPHDFRELDARLWQGTKRGQISADGQSLVAPAAHYHYTLHTLNASSESKGGVGPQAGLWAVPLGPRAAEGATYFWHITPDKIERWMGPALTAEQVAAVRAWPTAEQLALLVMTRQAADASPRPTASGGWLGFWGE